MNRTFVSGDNQCHSPCLVLIFNLLRKCMNYVIHFTFIADRSWILESSTICDSKPQLELTINRKHLNAVIFFTIQGDRSNKN